jgi:hypothetical protein
MGVRLNKFHQVFNIFLTLGLICAVAAVFLFFLTKPEQRDVTFWISIGVLVFAGVLDAMFASRIVFSDDSRQPPHTFTQLALAVLYTVVVIVLAVVNGLSRFGVVNYFLVHIGVGLVFLLPLQMVNMAAVKSGGQKSVAERTRNNLRDEAARVQNILSRVESHVPGSNVTKLRKLADNLLYSEPADAPPAIERALTMAIDDLEARAEIFIADPDPSIPTRTALSDAVDAADRALKVRNEAILRSK